MHRHVHDLMMDKSFCDFVSDIQTVKAGLAVSRSRHDDVREI